MKEFKDTIQKYLEQRVAEDPLFAPKFENPKKNTKRAKIAMPRPKIAGT